MAEKFEHVIISMNEKGVATLQLNRKPVNALNLELMENLNTALDKLQSNKSCKGIIITSAFNGVFSAGVDFREDYKPEESRLRRFYRLLQEFCMKLYGSRQVTVAALNGHSPASGCLIALACDYRIMAEGKYTIGFNEVKLGTDFSFWVIDMVLNTVGHRKTELVLQLGELYSAKEAKRLGLVDELAPMDQIMTRAHVEMDRWIQIPEEARVRAKLMLRQPTIDKLRSRQQEDIDQYVSSRLSESAHKSMEMYLDSFKKRKQSKL